MGRALALKCDGEVSRIFLDLKFCNVGLLGV